MSYEQQQHISREMQALDLEEAASNDVEVSLSLLEYEQAVRPSDRLRTVVRFEG